MVLRQLKGTGVDVPKMESLSWARPNDTKGDEANEDFVVVGKGEQRWFALLDGVGVSNGVPAGEVGSTRWFVRSVAEQLEKKFEEEENCDLRAIVEAANKGVKAEFDNGNVTREQRENTPSATLAIARLKTNQKGEDEFEALVLCDASITVQNRFGWTKRITQPELHDAISGREEDGPPPELQQVSPRLLSALATLDKLLKESLCEQDAASACRWTQRGGARRKSAWIHIGLLRRARIALLVRRVVKALPAQSQKFRQRGELKSQVAKALEREREKWQESIKAWWLRRDQQDRPKRNMFEDGLKREKLAAYVASGAAYGKAFAVLDPTNTQIAWAGKHVVMPARKVRRFALNSDGADRALTLGGWSARKMMRTMRVDGVDSFAQQVRAMEENDPDCLSGRVKIHDDLSIVYVDTAPTTRFGKCFLGATRRKKVTPQPKG